jgi:ATP-binding protein involved in chromosome partitioning
MEVPFLGSIPLDPDIVSSGETGAPIPIDDQNTSAAGAFISVADQLREQLKQVESLRDKEPSQVGLDDKGNLVVQWPDGRQDYFSAYSLRVNCPCAQCIDEDTGEKILDPDQVPHDVKIEKAELVGRYALSLEFSDGHSTGIYRFDRLKELAEKLKESGGSEPESFEV